MQHKLAMIVVVALTFALTMGYATAEETQIDVRVISKGGKFIGTSMGGVLITIRDAKTAELLAKGVTRGTTGDTEKIIAAHR